MARTFRPRRGVTATDSSVGADQEASSDEESIVTVDGSLVGVLRTLWDAGFRWNPSRTVKFRRVDDTCHFALSVVYRESVDTEDQQDVQIFRYSDGTLDVSGHYESGSPTSDSARDGKRLSTTANGASRPNTR